MNRGPFIFLGVLIVVSLSWALTLVKPISEAGNLSAIGSGADRIPSLMTGAEHQGRETYQELGCVACHTQQVRAVSGSDVERGWGERQTVALDYIDQSPVFTGDNRFGPDLTNVGARRPDVDWHLLHLYNPQITSPGSNMPPYGFLFETRQIVGEASERALDLPQAFAVAPGYEVVPTRRAEALAAYLASLNISYEIETAPSPEKLSYK
ncbi:cbb3-type cytochrome c oxidase subunit II [Pelagicoccus sp. SDUM812003]|uniref:cbb3-type cytochrome c oxidase subunit II n=1 Tax=Pelagicoccus sp. SDUM812003 TaxID=3041267 RepID=UPI00280E748E|nr:cbb3-type cytochrome c oxidase subunit II [Pelagicoccus sp. SDUM812003]MDQ8202981.1 cbb3-type cytochrome c oxidase subunit II [Pelagicoccus sp. SDUM812003]